MPQMTIEYDENAALLFDDLKEFFGVRTKVAVIRRSLAITRVAVRFADKDKCVRFVNPTTKEGETFVLA